MFVVNTLTNRQTHAYTVLLRLQTLLADAESCTSEGGRGGGGGRAAIYSSLISEGTGKKCGVEKEKKGEERQRKG